MGRRGFRVLALVVLLAACDASDAHRRRDPGSLVVAHATGPLKLDPVRVTDLESIEVGNLLYEGLARWAPGTTDVQRGLAADWRVSDDGRHWTFSLRPNVVFHDGTPFDADAVVFSFERVLDPKHPYYLEDAAYWRTLLKSISKVTAIDRFTIRIETAAPYAPLLGDLAMYPMVSPSGVRRWGDAFKEHPVGTGPFELQSWSPGEHVIVKRFERYWDKPALLDQIVFRVVVDARQRLVELESGSVDLATSILPDEQAFVELHPDLRLTHIPGNSVSYLAFNLAKPYFQDVRVRRAASHAINKEPIVKLAYQGRAVPADGPLPPTQWGYHLPKTRYPYDAARAKALLDEAIADKAFDPSITYKLYALSTPRSYVAQPERVARYLQAALAQVGIKTDLVIQPYEEHRASLERGEHDLALFGWVGDTGDPDNFLYVLFHSDNAFTGPNAQNFAWYRNSVVDKLLIEAQIAVDEVTRTTFYNAAQDRIAADAPWVPIAHAEYVVAARSDVQNLKLSPLGHPIYRLISRAAR